MRFFFEENEIFLNETTIAARENTTKCSQITEFFSVCKHKLLLFVFFFCCCLLPRLLVRLATQKTGFFSCFFRRFLLEIEVKHKHFNCVINEFDTSTGREHLRFGVESNRNLATQQTPNFFLGYLLKRRKTNERPTSKSKKKQEKLKSKCNMPSWHDGDHGGTFLSITWSRMRKLPVLRFPCQF